MPGLGMTNSTRNTSLFLIANRLGDRESLKQNRENILDGVDNMSQRLGAAGGFFQQDRMILDKVRSLDRALLYSYQACNIRKVSNNPLIEEEICRALINPDKTKVDYDDKILSIRKEKGFKEGDIFEWLDNGTFWLVYLQDYNEKAYFRSEIRRCQYAINWLDEEGNSCSTYAAVQGPTETKINFIQKHTVSVDEPNYSLHIYMPRNDTTLKYFTRYAKFYLQDTDEAAPQVCWRVEATDWISTPGILEITAVEYYANEIEDDIEAGLVGAKKIEQKDTNTNEINNLIQGESIIKAQKVYEYYFNGLNTGSWSVQSKIPVEYKVDPKNPLHVKLVWPAGYSGQFDLCYGAFKKTIQVKSLFQ